jgi:hypothetical protein
MPAAGSRGITAAKYALELGGADAGWVGSAEGGDAYADVVVERSGTDLIAHKHLGAVRYADLVLECGAGTGAPLFDWVSATLDRKHARKDGAVSSFSAGKVGSRLEFVQALVSSVAFPRFDTASKDAAALTVALSPEGTTLKPGGAAAPKLGAKAQKRWQRSSFRLAIYGLDCTHLSRVEPLVVVQAVAETAVGTGRDYEKQPAGLDLPDLVVTLTESSAQSWRAWHQSFVVDGQSGQAAEKSGTLELLAPDLKSVVFTLAFGGLGIYRLASEKVEAGSENVRRVTASMYCESMRFFLGAAPAGAVPKPLRRPAAVSAREVTRITR